MKAAETASQLFQNMPAVPLIDKAALICCVEYMRNSKKASPLISNLEKHKFDARAAVGDTFPGEELWISVSSTSNVDTLSLRPCHLVGYFNNAKWIIRSRAAPIFSDRLYNQALSGSVRLNPVE